MASRRISSAGAGGRYISDDASVDSVLEQPDAEGIGHACFSSEFLVPPVDATVYIKYPSMIVYWLILLFTNEVKVCVEMIPRDKLRVQCPVSIVIHMSQQSIQPFHKLRLE